MAGKSMKQMFEELGFAVTTMDGPRPPGMPSHDEIVASEARGQKELMNSTRLPFKTSPHIGHDPFAAIGVKLGDDVVDDLFVEAELPEGWTKRAASDHNMWSHVYDQFGRERIGVFYKAAFYDRRATMTLNTRFHIEQKNQIKDDWKSPSRASVTDRSATEPRFATEWCPHDDYDGANAARADCEAWLDENYPDWKDPVAYWDEEPA